MKQHHDDQPDYKYSQPRSGQLQITLGQKLYSFDEAHPALAALHFKRNAAQNRKLENERLEGFNRVTK